jgi:ABC-type dipeptide/oligopeptide/nickel transport system permease subunit
LIPTAILLLIAFVAIFADVLAPHDPQIGSLARRFRPPVWQEGGSWTYLLGTDHVGRDVLSRLIFGARVSMIVGLTAVLGGRRDRHSCSASCRAISAAGRTRW